jgi:cyclase
MADQKISRSIVLQAKPLQEETMKRLIVLSVLIGVGTVSLAVTGAQQQPAATPQPSIEVDKLKDNLYVLKGGGGNTAVFVMTNGVLVVDAKNPGWGKPILDKIKTLTEKPVTTLINTHTHGDHVSGNVEFPATVDIITHENTKANMMKMIPNSTADDQKAPATTIFQANNGRGLPKRTFKDKLTVGSGNDRVDLYYFGRGHTDGDAWVVFPALRTVHAGDIFSGKNIPLLDANNGGSAVAIPDSLQKAYDSVKNVDTIITGHGLQTATWADLKEYIAFNREFLADVRAAKQAGKSADEVAGTWKIPAKYSGYAPPAANRLKNNVQLAYKEFK